jgi:hypothetical protein
LHHLRLPDMTWVAWAGQAGDNHPRKRALRTGG